MSPGSAGSPRYGAVLLDAGGTLVGPRGSYGAVYARVLAELDVHRPAQEFDAAMRCAWTALEARLPRGSNRYGSGRGDEERTFLFVYLVFFGGSVALKRGELINVTFVKERLPLKWGRGATLFVFLIMLAFSLMASTFCTVLIQTGIKTKTVSPAMLIPMAYIYLPIFLGFAFLAFFSFIGLVNTMLRWQTKER